MSQPEQDRSDSPGISRLLPDEPFPPYSFVPSRFPHPESDPAGHSFGVPRQIPSSFDPVAWSTSREYLRGLDLFNHGYFWEAHEAWEGLWHACGRTGTTADFLKGLIKLAAAGVKHLEGRPDGARSHAGRAAELWQETVSSLGQGQETCLGLALGQLIQVAEGVCRDGWPDPPPLLFPVQASSENH
jgi:uncharacterized protein